MGFQAVYFNRKNVLKDLGILIAVGFFPYKYCLFYNYILFVVINERNKLTVVLFCGVCTLKPCAFEWEVCFNTLLTSSLVSVVSNKG